MEWLSYLEEHTPTALIKYAEGVGCASLSPRLWLLIVMTITSSILCFAATTVGFSSLVSIFIYVSKGKQKKPHDSRSSSIVSRKVSSELSVEVHREPLLLDAEDGVQPRSNSIVPSNDSDVENNINSKRSSVAVAPIGQSARRSRQSPHALRKRTHSLLCCCKCCRCCMCSTFYLIKTRNVLSVTAIICLICAAWIQMAELLMCQLEGLAKDAVFGLSLGFEITAELCLLFYFASTLVFYSAIVLRLYLSFTSAKLLPFAYPPCVYRTLLYWCFVACVSLFALLFVLLYSVRMGVIVAGAYQSVYVFSCVLLLIILLKKLHFIVRLPSYASKQYNRAVNLTVKYSVLTLVAMLAAVVVGVFRALRYYVPSAGAALYYFETQFFILMCGVHALLIYFQYGFSADRYYKYLGCVDDLVRFAVTCCLPRQSGSENSGNSDGSKKLRIRVSSRQTEVDISRFVTLQQSFVPNLSHQASSELTSVRSSINARIPDDKYTPKAIKMNYVDVEDSVGDRDETVMTESYEDGSYFRVFDHDP